MLKANQKEKLSSLKVEVIDLCILSCFYIRKLNRLGYLMQNSTRHYILEELTALRYMENGIILHLTNLDDDSSTFSYRKVSKEIDKTATEQEKRIFKVKIDSFRKNVNNIKVKQRNLRIAHLNYVTDLDIDAFLNFDKYLKPLIIEAFSLADYIWGEKIEMKFKLGSVEGILDFREIFDSLKFEINDQKEFT